MGLMDILQNAMNSNEPEKHFDEVAQNTSRDQMGAGIAGAMRSDQTPPFGSMVGQLFGHSSSTQQAGVLNQILGALGPAAMGSMGGGLLGKLLQPGQTQISPEQASQLSPAQVTEIATHAEQAQPGVVDQVGNFYAEHSGLLKMLGGTALLVAMAKIKENASRS